MSEYKDLPQEIKDNFTEEQWNTLVSEGVSIEVLHGA